MDTVVVFIDFLNCNYISTYRNVLRVREHVGLTKILRIQIKVIIGLLFVVNGRHSFIEQKPRCEALFWGSQ